MLRDHILFLWDQPLINLLFYSLSYQDKILIIIFIVQLFLLSKLLSIFQPIQLSAIFYLSYLLYINKIKLNTFISSSSLFLLSSVLSSI